MPLHLRPTLPDRRFSCPPRLAATCPLPMTDLPVAFSQKMSDFSFRRVGPALSLCNSAKMCVDKRSASGPGLGCDLIPAGRFKLTGGGGNRHPRLLVKGREDADDGGNAVDVRQDRRARVAEIREALDYQQPIVLAPIGTAVSLRGRGKTSFLTIPDLGDRPG